MANEITIKIKSDYDPAGIRTLRRDVDDLGKSAGDTDKAFKAFGDSTEKLGQKIRSSSSSKKIKLSDMIDPSVDGKFVSKFGESFKSSIAEAPAMAQAGAIIGAALAPEIGGLVAAAVVGGSGLIGIAGGLALAAKDPRVKGAGADLGSSIMDDLSSRAGVFVEPMLKGIDQVKAGYKAIAPDIGKAFSSLSGQVQPLVGHLVNAGQSLVKGWSAAAQASGPVLDAIGRLAESAGSRVEQMFETFAGDAPQAASAVDDLSNALDNTIHLVTATVDGLAKIKGGLDNFDTGIDKARYSTEDFIDKLMGGNSALDLTADGYVKGSEAAKLYRKGVIGIAGSINDYDHYVAGAKEQTDALAEAHDVAARAAQGQQDALEGLADELRAQSDPVFGLLEAQTKLGKAQFDAKKAADKYGESSPQYKKALQDQAKAALDLTGQVGKLGDTFNGRMTPSMRAALHAAGLTDHAINGLEKQFFQAATAGNRFSKTYAANVRVNGIKTALSQLYSLQDRIRDIPRAVTIGMHITGVTNISKAAAAVRKQYAHGGIKGAASGMVAGDLTWVGEQGPELVSLPTGSTVHSSGDSARMLRQMNRDASTGAGDSMNLNITSVSPQVEHTLAATLLSTLRFAIQSQGGNVQTVLGRG